LFLAVLAPALFGACGTDANGIETCKKIEEARCRRAPDCGMSLATPVHVGNDVNACIRYYDDACLHGIAGNEPSAAALNACIAAINSDCNAVQTPESNAACIFLVPNPPPDAGPDTAPDAASD
jgi:hypothetical protein